VFSARIRRAPRSTLFPYTPLFRSLDAYNAEYGTTFRDYREGREAMANAYAEFGTKKKRGGSFGDFSAQIAQALDEGAVSQFYNAARAPQAMNAPVVAAPEADARADERLRAAQDAVRRARAAAEPTGPVSVAGDVGPFVAGQAGAPAGIAALGEADAVAAADARAMEARRAGNTFVVDANGQAWSPRS